MFRVETCTAVVATPDPLNICVNLCTGKKAYLGELSFRIKRSAVSAGRTPFGPHRAIAEMCMALKKRGWDSPPMSLYEN